MSDLLPPVIAELFANTEEYSAKMDEASGKMEAFGKAGDTTGARMGAMWNNISTYALAGAAGVAAVAVKLAYDYNDALDLMQRTTHLTGTQMTYLRGQILNVSTATATAATTIVGGVTQLIKAGESEAQALRDSGAAAKYANAQQTDLGATLTAAIGIQKLHISGTHSIAQTLDIFTTAIKHSQLSANDLNSALGGRALSAFAAYHIDLKSAVTILAGFADQNLKGSRSIMVLKTGLAALEKPAETAVGKMTAQALAIHSVGLNMTTLADEVRKPGGMLTVLQQLSSAFDHNASSAMKAKGIAAWLQQIFGTSAGPAFTNIIARLPQLLKLYDQMNNSKGANQAAFTEWLKSPQGAFQQFKTTAENSLIRLGDVLLPKLTVGLITATRLVTDVFGNPTNSKLAFGAIGTLIGASIATKLIGLLAKVVGAAGGYQALGGAAEIAAAGTIAGAVVLTFGASLFGTLALLQHNKTAGRIAVDVVNFGGVINPLHDAVGWLAGIYHLRQNGTTAEAGSLAAAMKKYGITPGNATFALSPGTINYIMGRVPTHSTGSKPKTTVNVRHTASVKVH